MNLILAEPHELAADGTLRLTGRRARHVIEVHRASPGDVLRVGVVDGLMGDGTLESASPDEVVLQVRQHAPPPEPNPVELLLALPRPKILKKVLAAAASLGVKRITLVNSYRVEKSYFDSPMLHPDRMREHLLLGLEQARDTRMPLVTIHPRFKPFVEDELPRIWPDPMRRLVAHPVVDHDAEPRASSERTVVAIGPEGGWIPYEVDRLVEAGFQPFSLGPRILRVDTVVPYLLGRLS